MKLPRDVSRRALLVVLGCTICQTGAGLFYATRALAPDVIADLGWTRTMWSSAMAPMLLVSSVAQAFVGAACVRFGVRPVVMTSVGFMALTVIAISSMQSLWHFYVAMILLALGNAGIGDVAIGGIVTRWFDRTRGLALGVAMVGSNVGAVVFVHVIASVSDTGSWRTAALQVGLGGVALILPFAAFAIRDPRPGEGARAEHGEAGSEASGPTPPVWTLSTAVRRPAFWVFFFTLFCYALSQLGMIDHLILYLMDLGYSKVEAAGALELTMGAGIASKLGAGLIALRVSAKAAFVTNTALLAASFVLVPFAADPTVLTLFGVMFGVSTAARDVLYPLLLAEVFGARYFAQLYGFLMLAYFPGGGLGPIALARVHDVLGSYEPAFAVVAMLLSLAVLGLLSIRMPARPLVGSS